MIRAVRPSMILPFPGRCADCPTLCAPGWFTLLGGYVAPTWASRSASSAPDSDSNPAPLPSPLSGWNQGGLRMLSASAEAHSPRRSPVRPIARACLPHGSARLLHCIVTPKERTGVNRSAKAARLFPRPLASGRRSAVPATCPMDQSGTGIQGH